MKAIEIAQNNHVAFDDILIICKELNIPCTDENSEINDNDKFLIEKRIETLKAQKIKETQELIRRSAEAREQEGKKIRLKRKVHVSKELIKSKIAEEHKQEEVTDDVSKRGEQGAAELKNKETGKLHEDSWKKSSDIREIAHEKKEERREIHKDDAVHRRGKFEKSEKLKDEKHLKDEKKEESEKIVQTRDLRELFKPRREQPPITIGIEKQKGADILSAKESVGKRKKSLKDKEKDKKYKKDKEKLIEEKDIIIRKKKVQQERPAESSIPKKIDITENISVGELAKKMNIKASDLIAKLMKLGMMATINQVIDAETAEILASEYGTEVNVVSLFQETIIVKEEEDRPEDYVSRPPIVTVMGHVDHGKTKLLDAIRKTNVVEGEYGGITQHIGAYMVRINDQPITFLDTPGHEAFTTMRARGAAITDIVVLVVAADDGVKPQTVEAINHAKDANVPIVVAINKIDLPNANPERVRNELANYGLIPEEWGGNTLYAEISAKNNTNIDKLLEQILLQAELLNLKANPKLMAKGKVIEAKLDAGRGPVATVIIENGTLRVGDPLVIGVHYGKVRAMFDDQGRPVKEATPSMPVEILGISNVPSAGDPFEVVESEKYAKQISQKRMELLRLESAKKVRKVTLEALNEMIREGEVQELRVIIKADVDGSAQALREALEKLSTDEVRVKVIHSGTGGINESDVMLASASNAIIIGYHVRPSARVLDLAERERISIKFYNIIFEVTNDIKAAMEGMLSPEFKEEITGSGEVKQVFKIGKVGTVAGCIISSGKIERSNKLRLIRDGIVVYDGAIKTLKRFKDEVSSVDAGQECGILLDGFNDIKEGDSFETYRVVQIAKKL
ncbi:MAG: translation initiation factor IF-2 [Spirochaetes bacterium]|nr:translation initiation factor IF-2 [Spirochaetota bacterium]